MADMRDKNVDSLFDTLLAIARMGLMLVGLIGLSVELFREDGLLKRLFSKMLDSPAGLFSIPILLLVLYLLNRWLTSRVDGKAKKRGDLPMYVMMAIGAYFLYQLATTGSFAA